MKKKTKRSFWAGVGVLVMFVLWTIFLGFIDVGAIGPQETVVGFATLNGYVHSITGVNMTLYVITDWLGLVPIGVAFGFAIFGVVQWVKRKSILKVDRSLIALGGFYLVVMAVYVIFEMVVINYRPILIEGRLEASYPSSTTMLVMCVMPTAMMQLYSRVKNEVLRKFVMFTVVVFIAFMVICRILSGVHWITDIIGGALFSTAVVLMYYALGNIKAKN